MKFENVKIQPSEISAKGVSSAPDRLSGTAAENKAVFDRLIKDVVAEKFNGFVDVVREELEAIDLPPAGEPGYTPQKGVDYWTEADKSEMKADVLDTLREEELSEIGGEVADISEELCRLEEALAGLSDKSLSLGFTVHGGTSAPTNASEGDIWVNTDAPISGWAYSATEPANNAEGKVWFQANTGISIDTFAAGKVAISPLSAKQYIGGVWTNMEAKSYTNGEWLDWFVYLYNKGDECEESSGGFKGEAYKPSNAGGTVLTPVIEYFDNTKHPIKITLPSGGYCFSIFNETAFSVDNINQIEVVYSSASASGITLGVTKTKTSNYSMEASAVPASGEGTAVIDVSALTGDYYFAVFMSGASGSAITISEIRLNKSFGGGAIQPGGGSSGGQVSTETIEQVVKNYLDENPIEGLDTTVLDYGAKGDGATDDTAAFQSALAENRVVFVPGGTYILSNTLTIAANCCLELNQDTVLKFTQTGGNCIVLQGGATLRGNHAILSVPYAFTGNAVAMDTNLETDRIIPPYLKEGSNQFKRQRFVYDVNIIKQTSDGFCRSSDGKCSGTAIYMYCESKAAAHRWMWAISMSGVRIAGAFSYGIRALNVDSPVGSSGHYEDDAWNHDMRIEAVVEACEIGVAIENCNCAYLSVIVQPALAMNNAKYAKYGFYLNDAKAIDMTGSRVWDWDANRTLWTAGGQYQHVALIGNCTGLVMSDYLYYWSSADIRDLIYTDTPGNLEKITILQEPITRWFKTKENEPYFFDGNGDKRLALKEEIDEYFVTDRVAGFTDVLATAIDANGAVYNGVGYKAGVVVGADNGAEGSDGWYVSTGYIACKAGDTLKTDGLSLKNAYATNDGGAKIVYFDKDFKRIWSATAVTLNTGSQYYQAATLTDNGFEIYMKPTLSELGTLAYVRLSLKTEDWGVDPVIAINENIGFEQHGFLVDGIKVKGENIIGGSGGVSSWNDLTDKPFYEDENAVLLPPTEFGYDGSFGLYAIPGYIDFMIGKTYTVNWNGVEYTTEGVAGQFNGVNLIVIGNPAALGGANNNLPFAIACLMGAIGAIPLDGSIDVIVGIRGYEIKQVPNQYLPKTSCAFSVTDDTESEGDTFYIKADTTDLVDVLLNNGTVYFDILGSNACIRVIADYIWVLANGGSFEEVVLNAVSGYGKSAIQCLAMSGERRMAINVDKGTLPNI